MTPESLTAVAGQVYLGILGGGVFALILAESFSPLSPFESDGDRIQHLLSNLSLWGTTLVFGDLIVGDWLLGISDLLFRRPNGMFRDVILPMPIMLIVGILMADFGEYLYHRLAHANRWLWRLHAVHHADDRLDVSSALRFHPFEAAASLVFRVVFFALLGLPLWLVAVREVLMLPVALLQHANFSFPERLDGALRWVFVTPALHKSHHSPREGEYNRNFGEVFSVWDRIAGTLYEASLPKDVRYGLPSFREGKWQTLRGMLSMPFAGSDFSAPSTSRTRTH